MSARIPWAGEFVGSPAWVTACPFPVEEYTLASSHDADKARAAVAAIKAAEALKKLAFEQEESRKKAEQARIALAAVKEAARLKREALEENQRRTDAKRQK